MKIAFVDLSGIAFSPLTPEQRPLGGMQSGVCYLTRELQRRGHEISIFNATSCEGEVEGIQVLNFQRRFPAARHQCDAYVSISCAGLTLRPFIGRKPLILFTGHNSQEPSMQALSRAEEVSCWDHFVFKSNWQADSVRQAFALDPRRISIITNAVSPAFESAPARSSFFFTEGRPPVLYFSSTPFRGLDILAGAFPLIRKAVPRVRAKVFSSMAPYHALAGDRSYDKLYQACTVAGMEYVGSLNQPDLSRAVAEADVLAFPSTYPETSCITIMEAMAASSLIVSRALGAIPETSAGFARLMPEPASRGRDKLAAAFARHMVEVLRTVERAPMEEGARLRDQRRYCLTNYSWAIKAREWEALLGRISSQAAKTAPDLSSDPHTPLYNYVQTIEGNRLYVDPRDGRARRLTACSGTFNTGSHLLWRAALRISPWNVVVDAGANYGEMLHPASAAVAGQILAVEPNPDILPYLKKTVADLANVTVIDAALAAVPGQQRLTRNLDWSGMTRLGEGPNAVSVEAKTVDQLLDGMGTKLRLLMKLDAEGGEWEILEGAARSIESALDFCCLLEVSHLPDQAVPKIEDLFTLHALDMRERQIREVQSLAALRGTAHLWQQDVLIMRRRGRGPQVQ